MSKLNIVVFGLLGLISVCLGQGVTQLNQQCDQNVGVVNDFNAIAYLGVWYDLESLPSTFQSGTCNTATYTLAADGAINVQNSQKADGVMALATGVARPQAGAGTSAKFDVTIGTGTPAPYWVLDTDYETFALVYSCRNEGTSRVVNSWKLARNRGPLPAAATARINAAINRVDALSAAASLYVTRNHDAASCFVEYTGTCPTVTGVADFNVNNYLGTWKEVARYPQTAQTGQCNRASYTSGTGAVNVLNSQVVNEALATISGTATVVPGQSGVLAVTLNTGSGPQAQNLVVLATDYENYALLYSCAVLDNGRRRVGSWLLRRNLEPLSTEANVAINNAITVTQDLQPGFYYPTNQDNAACFYYPLPSELPNLIELPGPCDPSITGLSNFEVTRFLGDWIEDARYPQTTQTGQCNRATYAAGATAGVFTVENSQVTSETLSTISGQATAVADQPGVLAVTFSPGGVFRTQNLYVLGTDYDSYALLYSCTNVAGNRRQVGSWKLRRNVDVPLTTEATNNINAIITRTQGLREEYYRDTLQTSAACFYYPPVAQLPDLIELPGPCDTSISGLANFNVNGFLGTWYEVARYPQAAQTGQCNRATWAAGATSGAYTVVNRQVTNESLSTISGQASAVPNQPGVLAVTFNIGGVDTTQNIYVLATDYETYALLYTCTNIAGNRRRVGSWRLRKNLDVPLTTEATNNINAVIEQTQGLRQDYYRTTYQTNAACFYYPEADELLPGLITLPGPCDTSITGVANFDASRYLGTWLEIARYPQTAQTGQCNRANYAQGTGLVTVQNTQVVNQQLLTITGEARTTEQSGVLRVTFNINNVPTTQDLYVLATDYDNYALVYTCTNIDGGNQRQVGSWKLRRSLVELSEAANNAINTAISQTQGLREEYYQPTSQTSDACFYYPAQTGNEERVIIPGQCDAAYTGLANINVTRFADDAVWYQIRRYDAVGGRSCIATRFNMEGDTYIDVNFVEVVGEEVTRVEAIARLDSAATGRFVVTYADSGRENEEFYILATDYENFAIAYNCSNEGANQRHVGVWLLSRTRAWPAAGNTALNNLIASRQEITNLPGYFKDVPHNEQCPEPSSAFLFRSSIIVIFVCTVLQLVW